MSFEGALWGALDIQKMANNNLIHSLRVTMSKHPSALKLNGPLEEKLKAIPADKLEPTVLYEGPVRDLCPLAPQNVNTMACAALAAHTLGFDGVVGRLVADPRLTAHVIDIEIEGPPNATGERFTLHTRRSNPAPAGAVTGAMTYASFLSSLLLVGGGKDGVHFC